MCISFLFLICGLALREKIREGKKTDFFKMYAGNKCLRVFCNMFTLKDFKEVVNAAACVKVKNTKLIKIGWDSEFCNIVQSTAG